MTDEQPVSFDKSGTPIPGPGAPPGYGPTPYGSPPYGPPPYGYPPYGPPPYAAPQYGYGYPAGPPHEKPPSNIGWAIAAIFAFWPLAIPAFIYANKVDTFWFAGNRVGAQQASKDARLWGMIGVIIGAVFFVLALVWIVFVFTILADAVHNVPDSGYPTAYPS